MNLVLRVAGSLILISASFAVAQAPQVVSPSRPTPTLNKLVLTSTVFSDNGLIPDKYASATALNTLSPPLNWTGAPDGTVSFVLTVIDEEFARQKKSDSFYHWIIFNVPGTATNLPEGVTIAKQLPDGSIQPQNGRWIGYAGPGAPAAGQPHHYIFRLMALDTRLDLGPDASATDIIKGMDGHILDRAVLIARYKKPQ
jgi:Raf kinase inhibitor-like YbhB/YbcL family protein